MYLKCQCPINPKFPLCQIPIRANSKNKTEDFVYWRSILLFRLAPLLLHIVKHGSNVVLLETDARPLPHLLQNILASNS